MSTLVLGSSIPGRARWRAPELKEDAALAQRVADQVCNFPGVLHSEANLLTGSLLVRFDSSTTLAAIRDCILFSIAEAQAELPVRAPARDRVGPAPAAGNRACPPASGWRRYAAFVPFVFAIPAAMAGSVLAGIGWVAAAGVAAALIAEGPESAPKTSGTEVQKRSGPGALRASLLEPYRARFVRATVLSALNKILDLSPPLFIGAALNIIAGGPLAFLAGLGFATVQSQLWVLGGLSILGWGLASFTEFLNKVAWRDLSQTVQHDLRLQVYDHIQRLDVAYVEQHSTGQLAAYLHNDIETLGRFISTGCSELVQTVASTVMISAVLLWIAPGVTIFAVLALPFVMVLTVLYHRYIGGLYGDVRERASRFAHLAGNNISGITTIRILTAEARESERIRTESDALRTSFRRVDRIAATYSPSIRMVVTIGATHTLIAGGLLAAAGTITLGAYSIMVFLTQRLIWPLVTTGDAFDLFQHSRSGLERIVKLLEVEPEIRSGSRTLSRQAVRGQVVFDRVTFQYRENMPVFSDLSLRIEEGEHIGIVGATGAGKTTLSKLILRFYEPQSGNILIDGHDIRDIRIADLRSVVGLVGQENFLFFGTVRENIAFGRRDADFEDIVRAAKVAGIDEFIRRLPDGYDTFVGEYGYKLSGGERQRISIARTILRDPPILLLDEATSSVDYETEAALKRSLARITEGKTTITIAHRLSTVRKANRICVLSGGEIREEGRHEELLRQDGIYASLWRIQTGEEEDLAR